MYNLLSEMLEGFGQAIAMLFKLVLYIFVPFVKAVLFCLLLLMIYTPIAMIQGYVLMMLWTWFIVPLGFKAMTLTSAMGAALMVNLLTSHFTNVASEKDAYNLCGFWIIFQVLIFGVGYLIKTCADYIQ